MKRIAYIVIAILLAGCGNGKRIPGGKDGDTISAGSAFSVADGSCPPDKEKHPSGTCSLLAAEGLGSVDIEKSFALAFLLEDGGSMTLHAFSVKLEKGVDLRFARTGSQLEVSGSVGGKSFDYSKKFAPLDASKDLSFQVDIHNSEEPTHMVIWPASAGPGFALADNLVNSVCSRNGSTDCHNWETNRGQGKDFAVSLNKAALISAQVSDAKFKE